MVKIISAPHDVLSKKAEPIAQIDDEVKVILSDMKKALLSARDPEGVGLAAPQIGKRLSIFLMKPLAKSKIRAFINPEIINEEENIPKKKTKGPTKLEGCLSLPGIWGEVRRKNTLQLSYLDETGTKHVQQFKGFVATIIQHELDHLNGILFTERVLEQEGVLYKSHKDEKGEDIFEEIEL
ncbi:MAG: peptide deformylase [Patescibacteria group bacterium]